MTTESLDEALARLYDLDLELAGEPGDLDLYLALAQRTGGPVLELAVGTGRVAVPLAAAGHAVTGVDLDPAMLARARERARAAHVPVTPPDGHATRPARARGGSLTLVEADVVGLALPAAGSFQLVYIALSSLLLLASRSAQGAALQTMARHLAPGGLAVVDVVLPDAEDLARYDGRVALESARMDPATDRLVTKLSSARHDAAAQLVTLTTIFEEGSQGAAPARWLRSDRLRLVSADELAGLAETAGLIVEQLAGGYDLEPIGPGAERVVMVARRS